MKKYTLILIGIWVVAGITGVFAQTEESPTITVIEDFANGPTGWFPIIGEPGKRASIQAFTDEQFPDGAAEIFLDSSGNNHLGLIKQVPGFPLDAQYITLWVKGTGKKEEIQFLVGTSENKHYSVPIKLANPSWHKIKLPVSGFLSMETKEPLVVHRVNGIGFIQFPRSTQKNFWVARIYVEGKTLKDVEQENKAQFHYDEGLKLYGQKKYDLAFIEWNKAIILDPKNEEIKKDITEKEVAVYRDNGMNFYKEGKVTLAVEEWEKASRIDPGNKEIRELISEATAPPVAVIDDFEIEPAWNLYTDQGKNGRIKRIADEQFPAGAAEVYMDRIEGGNLAIAKIISQTIWGKDMDRLTLWVKGDGSDNAVMVAFATQPAEGGQRFYISPVSMKDTNWHKVTLKFSNFIPMGTKEPLIIKDVNLIAFTQNQKSPPVKFKVAQIRVEMKSAREIRIENEVKGYYNAGLSLYKDGKYASAVAEWEKALTLEPDNNKIRTLVNDAKQKVGTTFDEKRAQSNYDKGLEAYKKRDYETAQDSLKEAITLWMRVVGQDPQNLPASQSLKNAKRILRKIEVEDEVQLRLQKEQEFLKNKDYKSAIVEYTLIDSLCQSILKDEPTEEKISKLRKEAAGYLTTVSAELEATKALEQARSYYQNRQVAEASVEANQSITQWKRILEKEPGNARAKEGLTNAIRLAELIELEKEIWVRLGKSALFHQAKNYENALSEYTISNSLCLRMLVLDPANPRIIELKDKLTQKINEIRLEKEGADHYSLGIRFYQKGDYPSGLQEFDKAIQSWNKALEYEPQARFPAEGIQNAKFQNEKIKLENGIKTHQNRGAELQAKGDYEGAINEYESANTLCMRILLQEPENKKIKELKSQIQCNLSFVKGLSFYEKGRYAEAILEWKQVLSLNPKHPEAQSWIDRTTQKEKKKAEVDVVNRQIFEKGLGYYNKEEYTKAITEWKKVIAKEPDYPQLQTYYKQAMEKLTVDKDAKLSRAREYNKNGDLVRAVREWRAVLRMDLSDKESSEYLQKLKPQIGEKANALYLEGINYYMKENVEKAISLWEDVLILDPANEKARKNIEKAKVKLKK